MNNSYTDGLQRSLKARRNILASLFIKGGSILIGLMLVPIAIHYVNPVRYGIWITLSSIIVWVSVLDVGLGHGLRNRFAEALARGEKELARIYVSTTYAILSLIMGSAFFVFIIINQRLNWSAILNAPSEMSEELSFVALVVFGILCLQFVLRLLQTVLIADQYPSKASFLQLLGNILALSVIYLFTKTTNGSLLYLAVALTLAPAFVLVIGNIVVFRGRYRFYAPSLKYVRFSHTSRLMTLGVKFFVIQMSAILIYQTANIIISQLFGPEKVTTYNIAFKYFSLLSMVFMIIMSPYWSAITDAFTKGDILWVRKTMRNLQYCFWIMAGLAFLMYYVADWTYAIWVGKSILIPSTLSLVVAVYVVINAWNALFSYFLNGFGKVQIQVYCSLGSGLLNIPLAIYLGRKIGIEGVVMANIAVSVYGAVLYPIQYNKIVNERARGIWNR